ncbi:MAG TPA: hypothetical protein VHT25_07835 [Solirubrobacteraceae bacterium]|jgi:hypothetical protein|nr:hypothetical protein [Solirubrobacteraceae bacterium]
MAKDSNRYGNSNRPSTFDVCLLLRAHAESRWLSNELTPVLREIERRETIAEQQLGAALAYLEVLWIEACARARETEAARVELDALGGGEQSLPEKARRYHAAVRRLRDTLERRVDAQLALPPHAGQERRLRRRMISRRPADR